MAFCNGVLAIGTYEDFIIFLLGWLLINSQSHSNRIYNIVLNAAKRTLFIFPSAYSLRHLSSAVRGFNSTIVCLLELIIKKE